MTKNSTINLRVNSEIKEQAGIIPRAETLAYMEHIENGEEELVGPFSTKEELWKFLGI